MKAWYKGKVERSIHYIANSFFHPLVTRLAMEGIVPDLEQLNAEATLWRQGVANTRVHGTTGEVPATRMIREREHLMAPAAPAVPAPVTPDGSSTTIDESRRPRWPRETLQRSPREYDAVLEELVT